jgi:NAD(P)-dependent dehydrogenase (short-subunit alcohol dehydrogenase family)
VGAPISKRTPTTRSRRLSGHIALVTGASRGIGFAIARALAAEGCHLILTARHKSSLERVSRELKATARRVLPIACDVRDPKQVRALAAAVRHNVGRLNILVNNAGIAHSNATVEKLSIAEWKDVIETNLTGTFLVTQAVLPVMKRGGTVVNNLSIAATRVFPGLSAYNASKHGLLGLTNTLREELRHKGIRVIALLPGATDTDIWKTFWPRAPRKKMMSPDTVAVALVNALTLPANSTVEELMILPTAGTL